MGRLAGVILILVLLTGVAVGEPNEPNQPKGCEVVGDEKERGYSENYKYFGCDFDFDNTYSIGDIITFLAVCVALFGPGIWGHLGSEAKRKNLKPIIKSNLEQLKSDITRIIEERNSHSSDKIVFSATCFSEISGYYFLFQDILIPNAEKLKLKDYPKTIDFFSHYKMNVDTLRARRNEAGNSRLTRATVELLLERLQKAIHEFR